ncbi:MAG TPA: class I adenylate-forming enzyme family protein [Burkholderiaceae bacterium]|nr:class I adenylate-forming enzyme family protein [Burkholderiaceae bacterium]
MNFALFLEIHARGDPRAIAVVDRRVRLDWGTLDALASRFAHRLRADGVVPGERVAIWLPNRAEVVIAMLGAMKLGAVPVPMNWRLQAADLGRLLAHAAPSCVLTDAARLDAIDPALHARTLTVGEGAREGSFWTALDGQPDAFGARACQSHEVANLLYTSGTTSVPKAAIHTHGMRVAVAAAMADCFRLSRRDVGLAISPLFHTSGLSVFSNTLFVGCPLVLLDRWDLGEFVDAIARERVTFLHVIGTIVVDIARAPEAAFEVLGERTVRFAWGGGHSLDAETFEAYEKRVGGVLLQGYSRTEGGLTYNLLDRAARRFDHNGHPNRNSSDVAVVDPASGRPLATGETGEIVVRGDGVSPGYWDGDYVRSPRLVDGGWQPTGDLGFLDADGALHFLGRRDLMIKTGGENVYPAEVEAVLLAMPGVADAVVVGLPDARLGQRVAAAIVRGDPALTEADVDRACRAALGGFKIPRTIAFVDALPRLGTQKVDLAACRALLAARAA